MHIVTVSKVLGPMHRGDLRPPGWDWSPFRLSLLMPLRERSGALPHFREDCLSRTLVTDEALGHVWMCQGTLRNDWMTAQACDPFPLYRSGPSP